MAGLLRGDPARINGTHEKRTIYLLY